MPCWRLDGLIAVNDLFPIHAAHMSVLRASIAASAVDAVLSAACACFEQLHLPP